MLTYVSGNYLAILDECVTGDTSDKSANIVVPGRGDLFARHSNGILSVTQKARAKKYMHSISETLTSFKCIVFI
jgi:hypothetical protein